MSWRQGNAELEMVLETASPEQTVLVSVTTCRPVTDITWAAFNHQVASSCTASRHLLSLGPDLVRIAPLAYLAGGDGDYYDEIPLATL
ncbi:hypothetical protein BSZ23_02750 [Bradyrhizobium canariense]|nr:hypothetical protein BSZ23_02750 [Bradyrhizobium canariense]